MRTLLVVIGLALVAAPALADDKAKAKELFDEGMKHFNVAEYPEAIAQWKQGYLLSKKPLFLFNIAQAYRFAGDCVQAMTFYESYAREEQNIKNQDELDAGIAACKNAKPVEKQPEQVTTQQQSPPPEKTPPVQAPPTQQQKPIEAPVAPAPAPETSGGGLRTAGIVTAGVGVLAGAAGIYFALQSKKWSDKLNGWNMPWTADQNDWQTTGQNDSRKAWIAGGAGIALVVAGGVMFALGGSSSEHQVAIAPTRGGAAVAWGFSF